jgi:hypothetical protein
MKRYFRHQNYQLASVAFTSIIFCQANHSSGASELKSMSSIKIALHHRKTLSKSLYPIVWDLANTKYSHWLFCFRERLCGNFTVKELTMPIATPLPMHQKSSSNTTAFSDASGVLSPIKRHHRGLSIFGSGCIGVTAHHLAACPSDSFHLVEKM